MMEGYDKVRLVSVPPTSKKARPCDVEVSSDGGKTWLPIPTTRTSWDSKVDDVSIITISFPVELNGK